MLKKHIMSVWQKVWDGDSRGRHYYSIKPSVSSEPLYIGKNRKAEVFLTRLRLGHCGLGWDLFKIGKHPDGLCVHCKQDQTVKHVIVDCPLNSQRLELVSSSSLSGVAAIRTLLNPANEQEVGAFVDFFAAVGLCVGM